MIQNRIIGVVGPTGVGKTFATAAWVQDKNRVIVVDFHDDDDDAFKRLNDFQHINSNPREFVAAVRQPDFKVRYVPNFMRPKTNYAECPALNWLCDFAFEMKGEKILVIDEAHMYCTPHAIPNSILKVAMMGRNRRLSIVYMTQSFTAVHDALKRNTHEFWFWRITGQADLENIRKRCGKDVAERVAGLRRIEQGPDGVIPGERVVWTVEKGMENGA